jgi:hypothetical protein
MPLPVLEPTSSSPEKRGSSAGRGTDSATVTDAGKAGDSKEDRWRCFSIRVVKDREFKLASFKWLKEESVEAADDFPAQVALRPTAAVPPGHLSLDQSDGPLQITISPMPRQSFQRRAQHSDEIVVQAVSWPWLRSSRRAHGVGAMR